MKTATTVQEFNFELPTGEITVQAEFKLTKAHRDLETGEWWDEEAEIRGGISFLDGTQISAEIYHAIKLELELPENKSLYRYLEKEVLERGLDVWSEDSQYTDED